LVAALRPAILDRDGAPLDPPEFAQPLHKRGNPLTADRRRGWTPEPYGRQLPRLLRARRGRLCSQSAAQKHDEVAPPHVSHRASSGLASPAALPHPPPAAEEPASPWCRPELF